MLLYKIYNIELGIFQLLLIIIWYINIEKFKYNDYLAIFVFNLLLYMIGIIVKLDKHYHFFNQNKKV